MLPWFSGREFKSYLPELGNASPVLIYNRDRDEGYVTLDKDGQPEIHYWPSAFDRKNMMRVRGENKRNWDPLWWQVSVF